MSNRRSRLLFLAAVGLSLLSGCLPSGPLQLEQATYSIPDNARRGDLVGEIRVINGDPAELDFRIYEGSDSFYIKPGTGTIKVRDTMFLDAETFGQLLLKVEAENPAGEKAWVELTVNLESAGGPRFRRIRKIKPAAD